MAFNRRVALASGAAVAGLGYWALHRGGPGTRRTAPARGVLRRGNVSEPSSLDPAQVSGEQENNILGDLLAGLMINDPQGKPIPGMAVSWTTAPDGRTWTFKLREASWSDGEPCTAEDFVFAWQRLLNPATGGLYAYFLYVIRNGQAVNAGKMPLSAAGIRALDPHTLEIQLEHPAPYLLEMLTHMTMFPQPRHVVAAKGKDWAKPGNYVSNGAYVLSEWVPNDHITLVKNARFYDAAKVTIQKVVFYPTDDYAAALKRMRSGELDTQDRMPSQEIDWIRANMPQTINPIAQLTTEFVSLNLGRKPFDDIRVRTALNMVTNRELVTDKIRRVGDTPAYNIIPPGIANYPGGNVFGFKSLTPAERLKQAQALMRQAGYGPDKRVKTTFMIRSTAPGSYRAIAAALQAMYTLIYVDITIIPNDMQIFYPTIQSHDYDIAESGWNADFDDPETFLNLFRTGGGDNWGQYSNPAFDKLLADSQQDTDVDSRGRKLAEAEALLLRDQAIIPLFFWANPSMAWPYIKGWTPNNVDIHRSCWISIDEKARAAQFAG